MNGDLGKLKQVDLRKVWAHEAHNFTQWLAQEDSLAVLSEEIGIDIVNAETEVSVGKFSVDILAEEEHTERKIIIENQLEVTNHDHLGKIITYASGLDAEIIIWIVRDAREEHERAIDWLNEHSDEAINFFVIKMEIWQIGDSAPAPKFQIISKPNDWAKTIKSTVSNRQVTEYKLSQQEFWNKFMEYASNSKILRLRASRPQHWYNMAIGKSTAHLSLTLNSFDGTINCELYIPQEKAIFYKLAESKDKIENELGMKLDWQELADKKASRIRSSIGGDIARTEEWDSYFEWLKDTAEKFHRVFSKYL